MNLDRRTRQDESSTMLVRILDTPPPLRTKTKRVRSNETNADSGPALENPSVEWLEERIYWPKSCIYKHLNAGEMKTVIEVSDEEQFAKGQNSRDLRVCYDTRYLEPQFMDAVDSVHDFFRFLQASTRGVAKNRPRFI